jgi:Flp pilus assembly protein TadD
VSVEIDGDLGRAESLIEVNRPNDALPILSAVIAMQPDNVKAFCLLARCHSMNGNNSAMLTAASNAVMYGPQQEWAFRLQSMALRNFGRHDESIDAALTAVRLAPNIWQPHVNLVEALLKLPDKDKRKRAYEAAKTAVALAPMNSSTHVTLGRVLMSIGERDAARACFERALGLNPTDATAHTNLAILDLNRGRVTAAGKGFRSVAAANPGNRAYVSNVSIAAAHWYARALDIGTFVCFLQIALDVFAPRPLGGQIALGLIAAYLVITAILFVRLPKPLRILVGRHIRGQDRVTSLVFLLILALVTWTSFGAVFVKSTLPTAGGQNIVLLVIMMFIRFRMRFQRWARPYLLRRRYRKHVIGSDAEAAALIPQQRPTQP